MLDGQIHDISQVQKVVEDVKKKLEKNVGVKLSKVAIAAAGRVLKTCKVKVEREINANREIDQKIVSSLEIEGIQKAQSMLEGSIPEKGNSKFYCIGYSIINYYLNDYVISTLSGHRGNKIGADILATFLPHIVVDSLYTVMDRVGLEVVSLTLEPIAAINVAIPKDLRMLNLAMVDIGAGTSDIAITKDGSVVAYAMAPIAGDEITEKIAQHYLVDFNTAEKIKISLASKGDNITFADILGNKRVIDKKSVIQVIEEPLKVLAETISKRILEFNNKSPNAVFLIGGGSQIPGLSKLISEHLNLPEDRVVVRGRDIIQNIKFRGRKLSGPESITPFGIAVTAQMQKGQDFLAVTVNGKKVRLFNSKKLSVLDALVLIGYDPEELIGRTGKSITFELNGKKRIVKGEYGKAAEIYVNEKVASLDTEITVGDNITVVPAEHGRPAEAKVSDYVKKPDGIEITFNGKSMLLIPEAKVNGKPVELHTSISNGDIVQINEITSIRDLLKFMKMDIQKCSILVNGEVVEDNYIMRDHDIIECKEVDIKDEQVSTKISNKDINVAEENIDREKLNNVNNSTASSIVVTVNGEKVELKDNKEQYIFIDIFNYIDFDLNRAQGRNIVLRLNGRQAAFTDIVKNGDTIDVYWTK